MQSQLHLPWRKIRHDPGTFKFTYKQKLNKSIDNVPADITFYDKSEKALKDRSYYAVWVLFYVLVLVDTRKLIRKKQHKNNRRHKKRRLKPKLLTSWPTDLIFWLESEKESLFQYLKMFLNYT